MYRVYQSTVGGSIPVTLSAAAANPRVDQIVVQIKDSAETPGGGNDGVIDVIAGTPTAGTTLDSRAGAADLTTIQNPNVIVLADVLINANNSPALSNANIRDRRPFTMYGTHPPVFNDIDQVTFQAPPDMHAGRVLATATDHASRQSACLMYLSRRIAATRIRFKYQQGATVVATGANMQVAICDASTRLIGRTGNIAFGGGSPNQGFIVNAPFTPALPTGYVFEPGLYWVWFGLGAITAGSSFGYIGVTADNSASPGFIAMSPNTFIRGTGTPGITFPASNTLLGLVDSFTDGFLAGNVNLLPVPIITLAP